MQLTLANKTGDVAFHRFKRPDETFFEVETTKNEYDALALENPTNPTNENGVWILSFLRNAFDTPSRQLEVGYYFDNGNNYMVSLEQGIAYVDKDKIVDNVLDDVYLEDIISTII